MLPALVEFIRKEVTVKAEKTEKIPHYESGSPDTPACYLVTTTFQVEDGELSAFLYPPDHYIALHSANKALIKQIGEHFDEALGKGEFQEYFGRFEWAYYYPQARSCLIDECRLHDFRFLM